MFHDTIVTQMLRTVPISAQVAFGYAQKSTLLPFVINYFMSIQPAVPRVANVTRFFRALHMIESYRLNYPQAQAQVFLEEMRETVRTSAATSEEREMFASVQEMYD